MFYGADVSGTGPLVPPDDRGSTLGFQMQVWDPALIIAQIVSIQCLFYLSFGLMAAILVGPALGPFTIKCIFDWRTVGMSGQTGWLSILATLVNAPITAFQIMHIVERAKKCLDFASTCYLYHFVFCCVYSGFPRSMTWWAVQLVAFLIAALLSEWLCVRKEMQDIPIVPNRSSGDTMRGGTTQPGYQRSVSIEMPPAPEQPRGTALKASTSNQVEVRPVSRLSIRVVPQEQV